eukprot:TRINITY_DN61683_c0_g1_i1.p1 TRINITY_DN61683_c0_g1~~TRINITY_DN61683_c0_g1_i1.p1  ORF type:complete len:326 (-),score=44.59 TRINITY_DN61683_c0_g1_i1:280-1257(-)
MLRKVISIVWFREFIRLHFVFVADVDGSTEGQISGNGEVTLHSIVEPRMDDISPPPAGSNMGPVLAARSSDIFSGQVLDASVEKQGSQQQFVRRERKPSSVMMANGHDEGMASFSDFPTSQPRLQMTPVGSDTKQTFTASGPLTENPLTATLNRQGVMTANVAGKPAVERVSNTPTAGDEQLDQMNSVMVNLEACVCLPIWQDTMSGPECSMVQHGCPPVVCDADVLPWCIVSNPGCLTEEFSEGGGWAYCNPKKNNPAQYQHDGWGKETRSQESVGAHAFDRLVLRGFLIMPVVVLLALLILGGGFAVKSHLTKLSSQETNEAR